MKDIFLVLINAILVMKNALDAMDRMMIIVKAVT
jgi:hypothetical protein